MNIFVCTRNEAIQGKKKGLNARYNIKKFATPTIGTKSQYYLYVLYN